MERLNFVNPWGHNTVKDDDLDVLHVGLCYVKWSASNCSAWNLLNLARSLLIWIYVIFWRQKWNLCGSLVGWKCPRFFGRAGKSMPVQCKLDSPEYELLLCFVMRWEWRKLRNFKLCNYKGTTWNLYNLIVSVGGKTILQRIVNKWDVLL